MKHIPSVKNWATLLVGYGLLEAVNRISVIKKYPLWAKCALVVLPTLYSRSLCSKIYWNQKLQNLVYKELDGAPIWSNKYDVPELDKLYFFLDDDNNFEPNIWHHATYIKNMNFQALDNIIFER